MTYRPAGIVCSLCLLAVIDVSLRVFGYARTTGALRVMARARKHSVPDDAQIAVVMQRVVAAAVLYPGRARCLEQSLACYLLLNRRGWAVQLRMGVQPYPFSAHAWLELNGRPLTETAETVSGFAMLPGALS